MNTNQTEAKAGAHTPGPWTVKVCNGKLGQDPGLYVVADDRPLMRGDFCRSEADADLIAAAPDMLAALRDLLAQIELKPEAAIAFTEEDLAAAHAAIAKVEGRS